VHCPTHPSRVADVLCGICGQRTCAECAPTHPFVGDPVCPECAPAVRRRVVEYGAKANRSGRGAGGALAVGVAAVIAVVGTLLLLPDSDPTVTEAPTVDDSRARLLDAYAGLELVALALEAHRVRVGDYPDELAALVPDDLESLPRDPYRRDGGPLRYLRDTGPGERRILYSVGPDRVDQGGSARDPLSGQGDLVYPVR